MISALALTLTLTAPYTDVRYLGVPFDSARYPLCQQYGCTHIQRLDSRDGGLVRFHLKAVPAKLTLVLSLAGNIFSLELWIPGRYRSGSAQSKLLRRLVEGAAGETFKEPRYVQCFNTVKPVRHGNS